MTTYSYAQLEGLWTQAGGSPTLAPIMAAIALAESGGDSDAENPSGATGVWQILGAVNPADQASLKNAQTNAKEAVLKYKSQGLGAWTTYTSGAYKKFLQSGVAAAVPAGGGSSGTGTTSIIGNLIGLPGQVTGFFSDFDHALGASWAALTDLTAPSTWIRATAGVAGLVLLIFGLVALAKATL